MAKYAPTSHIATVTYTSRSPLISGMEGQWIAEAWSYETAKEREYHIAVTDDKGHAVVQVVMRVRRPRKKKEA